MSEEEKRNIFLPLIPEPIYQKFSLSKTLKDEQGNELLSIRGKPGSQSLELSLFHKHNFPDPIIYAHLVDTLNAQIHVLLYIMNDPNAKRFNVDTLPDGTKTEFGTKYRNLDAELNAMEAGLLPGQIRKGLNILSEAVQAFNTFVKQLGHSMYFIEPLYYHNAVIFERYGFSYQKGRRKMQEINRLFSAENSPILKNLSSPSSPFRKEQAKNSIFYRSWAIHDDILGEKFNDVTMYKILDKKANIDTAPGMKW